MNKKTEYKASVCRTHHPCRNDLGQLARSCGLALMSPVEGKDRKAEKEHKRSQANSLCQTLAAERLEDDYVLEDCFFFLAGTYSIPLDGIRKESKQKQPFKCKLVPSLGL